MRPAPGNGCFYFSDWSAQAGADRLHDLRQALEGGHAAQPLPVVHRRIAADHLSILDIIGNAALGRGHHAVADAAVPRDPHLPGEDHVLAHFGGPGQSHLGAQQAVFAHGRAVSHLHQIVDLGPAFDAGLAHAGAVHAGVGLEFDIVLQHRWPGLHDLMPRALVILGKSEAVAADHRPVLEHDVIAQAAVLAHHRMGVREEIVADPRPAIDDHVRQQHATFADLDVLIDHHVGADVRMRADAGGVVDHRRRVDAGRVARRMIKQLQRPGERQVRIGAAQRRRRKGGKVLGHDQAEALVVLAAPA